MSHDTPLTSARLLGRLVLLLPAGALLIALSLGLGTHVFAPLLNATFGPPCVTECIDSPSVIAHQVADVGVATAFVAILCGAIVGGRRRDGWLLFNVASMILGYSAYAWAVARADGTLAFAYWGAVPFVVQALLISSLHPWLFERAASWRRRA